MIMPSNSAPPRPSVALKINAAAVARMAWGSERRPRIHGQASNSQKPISGLSRFRYRTKVTASSVKRCGLIPRPL
ncbi:hypothetical protein D3C80_1617370 [compost metagenome]